MHMIRSNRSRYWTVDANSWVSIVLKSDGESTPTVCCFVVTSQVDRFPRFVLAFRNERRVCPEVVHVCRIVGFRGGKQCSRKKTRSRPEDNARDFVERDETKAATILRSFGWTERVPLARTISENACRGRLISKRDSFVLPRDLTDRFDGKRFLSRG